MPPRRGYLKPPARIIRRGSRLLRPAAAAAPVTVTNDFEGGTNGVAISTSNAGGIGNTQFDQVTATATCLVNFDNTHPGHGSLGMLCQTGGTAGEAYVMWSTALGGATATVWLRAYLYMTANPGTQTRLFRWLNVSTVRGSVQITTTGKLLISDSAGTGVGTMTNSVPLNQLVRVEAQCTGDPSAGVLEVKLFDSPESTSPLETVTATAQNTGGTIDRARFGQTGTAVASITYWLDDLGGSNGGYLGPVGTAGTSANAEAATGTGSALDASVAISVTADQATGTGTALDATASLGAQADIAMATGSSLDATVAVTLTGDQAVGTGAALDGTAAIAVTADVASATGTAYDATVSTTGGTSAPADVASATGTALDASVAIAVTGDVASGTGTALDTLGATGAQAEAASGSGAAQDPLAAIAANAGLATGTGVAPDPTVSTVAQTNAPAELASGTGTAPDPSIAITVPAGLVSGTGIALDATVTIGREAPAGLASGSGAALDAAVAIVVFAEIALGGGQALDATIFIPPPVPPPRWIEGITASAELAEGGTASSGHTEATLASVGVVEGGSSQ
jgi:hypothetical protein